MKKPVSISDNEKWQAVVNCERNYDDLFFYGVKTTRIFCRPSCKSKTPKRDNVTFFDNVNTAIETGFRPCKRCCPDKVVYDQDLELVAKAKDIFDADYNQTVVLNDISKQLGVSINHLVRVFKLYHGLTPLQYLTKLKINKAAELLTQTDITILEIAYISGFNSLSSFYKCFKDQTGYSPNQHRRGMGD